MPLEPQESAEVIRKGLETVNRDSESPVTIDDEALALASRLSEGYPHFIQQFAYCAFEADTDGRIDVQDVERGANEEHGALDKLGQQYFQQMYFEQIGSNNYRAVLQVMADAAEVDEWTTKDSIRKQANLSETNLKTALHVLKERKLIVPKQGENGIYRLQSRSFAAWIRAKQRSGTK